jgi:hypothetical protein
MPLLEEAYNALKKSFKICIVSPELQGKDAAEIAVYKEMLKSFKINTVCTKMPDLWLSKE